MLTYGRDYRAAIKNTLFFMGKQLQEAAADGRKVSQTFKKPLPAAGGFHRPSRSCCRRQHGFADLQKAAAGGSTVSQTFKKPLPVAARFRKPSKGRCRWQEVGVN